MDLINLTVQYRSLLSRNVTACNVLAYVVKAERALSSTHGQRRGRQALVYGHSRPRRLHDRRRYSRRKGLCPVHSGAGRDRHDHASGQSWPHRQHERNVHGRSGLFACARRGLAGSLENLKQVYGTGRALSSAKLDRHVQGQVGSCIWPELASQAQQDWHFPLAPDRAHYITAGIQFIWLTYPTLQAARLHQQLHQRPPHHCQFP